MDKDMAPSEAESKIFDAEDVAKIKAMRSKKKGGVGDKI